MNELNERNTAARPKQAVRMPRTTPEIRAERHAADRWPRGAEPTSGMRRDEAVRRERGEVLRGAARMNMQARPERAVFAIPKRDGPPRIPLCTPAVALDQARYACANRTRPVQRGAILMRPPGSVNQPMVKLLLFFCPPMRLLASVTCGRVSRHLREIARQAAACIYRD